MSLFPTDEEIIMEGLKNENENLKQRIIELKQALANTMRTGQPTQDQINMQYKEHDIIKEVEIYTRFQNLREDFKQLVELQNQRNHLNSQLKSEGCCPNCGYTFS